MAMQPKNPRYKKVSEKGGRRYRDMVTGELLDRKQFEERTREEPGAHVTQPNPRPTRARKSPGNPGQPPEPDPIVMPVDVGSSLGSSPIVESGPVPVAEEPPPPPLVSMAQQAGKAGDYIEDVAAAKSQDALANMIGQGIAMCLNLIADVQLRETKPYLVIETGALERVTKPATRLVMRHLPVDIQPVGPDGKDAVELFNGVMYCVTAVWANKMVYDNELRKKEAEYARLYDEHYGPGSYQAARLAAHQQNARGTGKPDPSQQNGNSNTAHAAFQAGIGPAGTAGPYANGSGNSRGDGGRAASIINSLYQQYPNHNGGPIHL